MRRIRFGAVLIALVFALARPAAADRVRLISTSPYFGQTVVKPVDLTAAVRHCGIEEVRAEAVTAVDARSGRPVPCQFIPADDYHPRENIAGTFVAVLPPREIEGPYCMNLYLRFEKAADAKKPWGGEVTTPWYTVRHDKKKLAGLPSSMTFRATGTVFKDFRWQDRAYHRGQGTYRVIDDPEPKVELVSRGPLCTAVRVRTRCVKADGTWPASKPEAVYTWLYVHDQPSVYVTVMQRQKQPFAWDEWHFLELNHPGDQITHWAGGEPAERGRFTGDQKTRRFGDWAALIEGKDAIGMLRSGQMLVHDGKGAYGAYLHAHGDAAWGGFSGTQRRLSAWLWIGGVNPIEDIPAAVGVMPDSPQILVTTEDVHRRIDSLRKDLPQQEPPKRNQDWWRLVGAEQLEAQGSFDEAMRVAEGEKPETWHILTAGELGMILERTENGIRLLQLLDLDGHVRLLRPRPLPLFSLTLRNTQTNEEVKLGADAGWKQVEAVLPRAEGLWLRFAEPADPSLAGLSVLVKVTPDHQQSALRWQLEVQSPSAAWSVWRVIFPQLALVETGWGARVLFPRGCGEDTDKPWSERFRYSGTYPSGWTSMPFMATYDPFSCTGLYVGVHDPRAGTKDLLVEGDPDAKAVVLAFDHPAADMGKPGNDFTLSGEAVWQLMRGDWYDAALIYRDWVRREALWYPKLGENGREDTPLWMRELSAWALGGGAPEGCVPRVKEFADYLGVPVGFHWYNWHQIPFDNDYPHYFPTKDGFAEAVADLQKSNVHVMPYINGRLWDTHDRGAEDFEFSKLALPAATKNEDGEPYVETYGSKESDGKPVRLAAMCPATELWQDRVRGIVLRLMNECGVKGVYIDQIAAAKPRLCFDPSHGHPLGGGHWWPQSYWRLMERIRAEMPDGRMVTTECNAEPYTHRFDGYLTWHWQYDGQVPAFPAVYGGAIQMFGRAYRGGPTKDLALRMKAGQQLVYGEQIGWLDPGVVREKENAAFLRQVVRLRHHLRRYFYAGEMARPPILSGEIPTVTADWQWSGKWPVTTEAVMTGAWYLPRENRLVLLFVNVGDEPVQAEFAFDPDLYACPDGDLNLATIDADGAGKPEPVERRFTRQVTYPRRQAFAWEITPR